MQASSSFTQSVPLHCQLSAQKICKWVYMAIYGLHQHFRPFVARDMHLAIQRPRGIFLAGRRTLRYSYIFLAEAKSQIVPPCRGSLQHSIHSRDICHTSAIIPVAALCTMRRLGPYDSQSDFFGIPLSCRRLHRCLLNAPVLVLVSSRIPECIHEGAQPLPCAPPP